MSNLMKQIKTYIGLAHYDRLEELAKLRGVPASRIVAFMIDKEFTNGQPFEYDSSLPDQEYEEYAFADQAGKIIEYMKKLQKGQSLNVLTLLRHDMGVSDKEIFLAAFKECVEKGMIETFKPKQTPWADEILKYRLKGTGEAAAKARLKKNKEFETFLKLKKKYEGV